MAVSAPPELSSRIAAAMFPSPMICSPSRVTFEAEIVIAFTFIVVRPRKSSCVSTVSFAAPSRTRVPALPDWAPLIVMPLAITRPVKVVGSPAT